MVQLLAVGFGGRDSAVGEGERGFLQLRRHASYRMIRTVQIRIASIIRFNLICCVNGDSSTHFCCNAGYASLVSNCGGFVIANFTIAGRAADPSVGIPQRGRSAGRALGIVKDFPGHTCTRDRTGLDTRSF